ncbi:MULTISPECIES: type VI secretion system membrane subunit TssM [Paraburkholderia]|uniref:type VI secretion system membrane subunit TssM n=1 Tax=Paraburkholderia TaxID=1822464 RepID=UPI0038B7F719
MKKFFSFLASRQLPAFVALLIVALLIWFVGPLLAFGGLKPLAGIGMRMLVIALLLGGALLWLAGCSASPAFVALLCLLIWYAAPLLSFGDAAPFVSPAARVIAIAVVLGVFAAYWAFRLWQKMRADRHFVDRVLTFGARKEASPAAKALDEVSQIVSGAMARLKAMRTGARGLGRLFQGKRYLYELPWYITLGSKASGKTSAILQGGLSLPVADQMHRSARALRESTAHVDWWLTDHAVLIDTAGHYTRHGTSTSKLPAVNAPSDDNAKREAKKADQDKSNGAQSAPANQSDTSTLRAESETIRQTHDRAEWLGFLAILRQQRPRAPINGALLTVDLAQLTSQDETTRIAEAAALRARLADLRSELGIRFPVYLLVTKLDQLTGFTEYFESLTDEGRAQTWGFTLPYGNETIAKEGIRARCDEELDLLAARLANGVNTRLQDEYDVDRRRKLAALAEEFTALIGPVGELVERVFLDSRYDDTQRYATLRGVYFTSAAQGTAELAAQRRTVVQRLAVILGHPLRSTASRQAGNDSYFLRDLLTKVVFPEAQLVRPNLRWEFRFRLLRLTGHALALLLFIWLAAGVWVSFGNNTAYLDAVAKKAPALAARVEHLYTEPNFGALPDTLTDARYLATHAGLDLAEPDGAYRFGLYTAPGVVAESRQTYNALEDNLLLPQLVKRIESVLSESIAKRDPKAAYDALRVYLMLYDKAKFNADDVKAWVLDDWAKTDSAAIFGGRASMIEHVQQLFSGDRAVQPPSIRNDALIQQARSFLDSSNATGRLYKRAKAALQKEAPDEFTLLRAVGPQAGTVFTRASGAPVSRGVPGLFTFDGYRNLFDKRLQEFVQVAQGDDAWVMGRAYLGEAQKKNG